MITIRYFASIRESLGLDQQQIELPANVSTVAQLVRHLSGLHGESWARVLRDGAVLVALNQEVVSKTAVVRDRDEVAFFPPVTGG
ncbi:MAG: molybdopterin converting factor subunit 1 [Pseudomonadales bacterium]|nr:molybdopterin converting factor subunit 1 [Pseudomonadales bacterium]